MTDLAKLMREWLDVVALGPAEAWPDRAAEDIVIRLPFAPPGVAAEIRGRDEAVAHMAPVWAGKRSFEWRDVVIRQTEEPGLLVTTARSEVVLASGQPYANGYVILTRFEGGKVVEHDEYFNPLPVMEAFGLTGPRS